MAETSRGCRIAGIAAAGLIVGVMLGGLVGFGIGYVYVSSGGWGVDPSTSTVSGLRDSVAAFTGFIGFVIGALGCGVLGGVLGGVFAYIRPPRT